MRDLASILRKARDAALEDAEPGDAGVLVAFLEQELVSDADAEEGSICGNPLANRLDQLASFQLGHAVAEGPDPGKDEVGEVAKAVRAVEDSWFDAEFADRVVHASQVSCAVVDDADVHELDGVPDR